MVKEVDVRSFFVLLGVFLVLIVASGFLVAGQDDHQAIEEVIEDVAPVEVIQEAVAEDEPVSDIIVSEEGLFAELDAVEEVSDIAQTDLVVEDAEVFVELDEVVPFADLGSIVHEDRSSDDERKSATALVPYLLYENGERQIRTEIERGREIVIHKNEHVTEHASSWEKKVVVSSEEHFERELTVYANIIETPRDGVRIFWMREQGEIEITRDSDFDVQFYDTNDDDLYNRVSFVVPHLSEQTFSIVVNFTGVEDINATNLTLSTAHAPSGIVDEVEELSFAFNVTYFNLSAVLCDFVLETDEGIVQQDLGFSPTHWEWNEGLVNDVYDWHAHCYDGASPAQNDSESGNFEVSLDYAPTVTFTASPTTIIEGESTTFRVNISSPVESSITYVLAYDDGSTPRLGSEQTREIYFEVAHTYDDKGTYDATLTGFVDDFELDFTRTITVENATYEDDEGPEILLFDPDHDEIIFGDIRSIVNFTYEVEDEGTSVANCTYNLYYFNETDIGELVFDEFNNDITEGEVITVSLTEFDEGLYSWEIECYDSDANYHSRDRDFRFAYGDDDSSDGSTDSEQGDTSTNGDAELSDERATAVAEIEVLIDDIKEFLIEVGRFDQDQKEVVDDLGIVDDLVFYNKKLTQMRLDLEHNLDFIVAERRDDREEDILREFAEIQEKAVFGVDVLTSENYVKNSVDADFEEVVASYAASQHLILTNRGIRDLAEANQRLQNDLTVNVDVKHVELTYADRTEKISLITKQPTFTDTQVGDFIEVIPKSVAETVNDIVFVNEYSVIEEDPIVLVARSDLEAEKIVYYVAELVDFDDIEQSDTLLFHEAAGDGLSAIGGFSVLVDSATSGSFLLYLSWMVVLLVFVVGGFYGVRGMQMNRLRSRVDARVILGMIKESERALQYQDLVQAKEHYARIQEMYVALPQEVKPAVYGPVMKLQVGIDKKEAQLLIDECILALREGRIDEATMMYQDIQIIYHRMPDAYKEKIHEKMLPYMHMFG